MEKDGLYGLIDLSGKCVVPCEYDDIERLYYAGDYVYGLGGYACVEKGGKFGYVSLETGEVTCPINYVDPTVIGLSMVAPDITGALYIIAADGTTTPTDYAEVDEYTRRRRLAADGAERRGPLGPGGLARQRAAGLHL